MKTTILIAILALSINAFAQSKQSTINFRQPASYSIRNVQDVMGNTESKTPGTYTKENPGEQINPRTPRQRSLIQLFDSIYSWWWQAPSTSMTFSYKITDMVYDASHNLTSKLRQKWTGSSWVNDFQSAYTYNVYNDLTGEVEQGWNGSAWVNLYQYTYAYDANYNLTIEIHYQWNTSAWENYRFLSYTYDVNNNKLSEWYQQWTGSAWRSLYQELYTYDASNNQTKKLYQIWTGSAWLNYSQTFYTYGAGNLTSELYQTWNGSAWVDYDKHTYTYDASNNLTVEFIEDWNGSAWVNSSLKTYNYDANNNQTGAIYQNWNGSAWMMDQQYSYTYDANTFLVSDSHDYWNLAGTIMLGGDSTHYYFHTNLGVNELTLFAENIIVYPNPGSGKFTISSNSTLNSIEVYSLLGDLVYANDKVNHRTASDIDLSGYAKGVYFIKIDAGSKKCTRKIVVQ